MQEAVTGPVADRGTSRPYGEAVQSHEWIGLERQARLDHPESPRSSACPSWSRRSETVSPIGLKRSVLTPASR